jgi:hypothetical protein
MKPELRRSMVNTATPASIGGAAPDGGATNDCARGTVGLARVVRWFAFFAAISSACAPATEAKSVDPIRVEKDPPPAGATLLQTLTAVDGQGCGVTGTRGSYKGAIKKLRARAKAAGADYVQITSVKEPYAEHQCTRSVYTVVGSAYRVAAAPQQPVVVDSPPLPAAPSSATLARPVLPQSLSFSARLSGAGSLAVGFDAPAPAAASAPIQGSAQAGFELKYEGAARRLVLLRQPGAVAVSVAPEPFELDTNWHEWQLVRGTEQISISIDRKTVLTYVAPATQPANFRLFADSLELRNLSVVTGN